MERAPLPPHERTWRHPSELGPTRLEVDGDVPHRGAMLASGTLAVMVVAALVVAMTPRPSGSPSAISAATTAPATVSTGSPDDTTTEPATDGGRASIRLSSFTAIPAEIAAVPNVDPTSAPRSGRSAPHAHDDVVVLTEEHVYLVAWADVERLGVTDAVVLAFDGTLIARVHHGDVLVEPLRGETPTADD